MVPLLSRITHWYICIAQVHVQHTQQCLQQYLSAWHGCGALYAELMLTCFI